MSWIIRRQHADQIESTPWYDTQMGEYPPVNYTTVLTSHANSNNLYVWWEKKILPTTGPLSFLFALGLAMHLFMMPRISRFATETQVH